MFWECSECGGRIERARAPVICSECGTAGSVFVESRPGLEGAPESEDLRDAWLRVGLERAVAQNCGFIRAG